MLAQRALRLCVLMAGLGLLGLNLVTIARSPGAWYDMHMLFAIVRDWWVEGRPLYPIPDRDSLAPGTHVYRYPPFWALSIVPLVTCLESGEAVALWALISLLVFSGGLVYLMRDLRPAPALVAAMVPALALLSPFYETVHGPTKELWVVGLIAAAHSLVERRQVGRAAPLFAMSILFKLYPAFLVLYFWLAREWRFLALTAIWIMFLTVLPLPLIGADETVLFHGSILPQLGGSSTDVENVGIESLLGYVNLLVELERGVPMPPGYLETLATLWRVSVLGSAGIVMLLARRRGPSRPARYVHFALWVAALLVTMPVCWANYQILLIFPLSAIWLWVWQDRRAVLDCVALGLSVVVLALVSVPFNDLVRDAFVAPRLPRARGLATPFDEVLLPELHGRLPPAARMTWSATRTEVEDFVQPSAAGASAALARRGALSTRTIVALMALRPVAGALAFLAILAAAISTTSRRTVAAPAESG